MAFIKKVLFVLLGSCFLILGSAKRGEAQTSTAQDIQQLIYDIEKLTQFKAILSDMQTGYTILTQGYGEVKSLSEGNFNLHSAFLNSLMAVSPTIRQYGRVADIIADQASIVSECKATWKMANASGHITASELVYLNSVFSRLLTQSADNLTNLADILTANTLRMNDAERLQAIDHLYTDTHDKLSFLRGFDNQVALLSLERAKAQNDTQMLKNLYP